MSNETRGPGRNTVQMIDEVPTLQYANGKTVYRAERGAGRFVPLVGFHLECGKDEGFDEAMRAARVPVIEIKHQRSGGAEIKAHWSLGEQVRIYPITSGPVAPTVAASLRDPRMARRTAEAGIGVRWGNGERSKVAIRCFLDVLARVGYVHPVQFSLRSKMTDVLFGVLADHLRVCETADALIDRTRHPAVVTFHEIALPLGPDEEQEWGKGDTATVVPFKSLHAADVNAEYLRTVWRPDVVHGRTLECWESVTTWAADYPTHSDERDGAPREYVEDVL